MIRDYTRIYIDGAWVQPLDGKIIDIINPATERPAGQITLCTAADVDRAVAAGGPGSYKAPTTTGSIARHGSSFPVRRANESDATPSLCSTRMQG
jgi:hypothetical protein